MPHTVTFPTDPALLGGRLAKLRKQAGMTQKQLAEIAQVRQERISEYETGISLPGLIALGRLLTALRPTPIQLAETLFPESQGITPRNTIVGVGAKTKAPRT